MKIHLVFFSTLMVTSLAFAQSTTPPATPATANKPFCYSQDDLYHDLKYGQCDLFIPGSKNDDISPVCPELKDVLKHDPVAILMDLYDKAGEGTFLTQALNCSGTLRFVSKHINFSSWDTSSLLSRYAKKCRAEGIIYARLFGAEDLKDKRLKEKPSELIQKQLDEMKIKLAVETDAAKATTLRKSMDDCTKSLAFLSEEKIKLDDIRNLKIPTEAKVVFLKQADKIKLGDDSIERTLSSVPATPPLQPTADSTASSAANSAPSTP
jgi:hypothetical protein